jgi:hypothetical protein
MIFLETVVPFIRRHDKSCFGAFIPENINSVFECSSFRELIFPKHQRPSLYRSVPHWIVFDFLVFI